jgi:hypothetical protein
MDLKERCVPHYTPYLGRAERLLEILAFVMDNASNNDTMVQHFQQKCEDRGIEFDAEEARIRCMPHTVHLAAIKVAYDSFPLL